MKFAIPDDPLDGCLSECWRKPISIFSDTRTWSSLAMVLFLHSALACLLWYSPRPRPQNQKWIEVELVSFNTNVSPGLKDGPGGTEMSAAQETSRESPKLSSPLETKGLPKEKEINKRPQVTAKKNAKSTPPPGRHKGKKTTAQSRPSPSDPPACSNAPSEGSDQIVGTGTGAATSSGAGLPEGRGSAGGNGPAERAFGSSDGPSFLHRVMPSYPALAKKLEKQGTVLLRVTIDEHGKPVEVEILKKAGFGFDEEAVRAVKNSTFVPAQRNGKPLVCKALLPIRFVIEHS